VAVSEGASLRARLSPRIDAPLLERLAGRLTVGDGYREAVEVTAPATGGALGHVPHATEEDVELAVNSARAAQLPWARVPIRERAATLLRFHDLLLERRDEGLDLLQLEAGKARIDALEEILETANVSRYYGRASAEHLRPRRRRAALPVLTQAVEYHHPVGVVGVISPWNFPLVLGITDALPALVAGCAVVTKLDMHTPYSALWAATLLEEAGLPRELLQFVTGRGSHVGGPVIDRVDYIMFTGSTRVGREVAVRCADRLIGCSLELGGKNAMLVLGDADVERAAEGAKKASFSHAGQICVGMERVYVHEPLFDDFSRCFAERASTMKLRVGFDYDGEMSSLLSQERLDTVSGHVEDALAKGARSLAGARARPDVGPFFYAPTVLTGVTPEMTLFAEETFGPVVSLYPVRDADEAVRLANESAYGLNFSVWTRDRRRGIAVARALEAGSVTVNEGYGAAWCSSGAPMGGFKDSGLGRRHGAHGIEKYTEQQTVAVQRILPTYGPPWLSPQNWERFSTSVMRALRRIPGVR
jgi:succinate-semialdehyde dehydrogenase/glutarate-semialdehyde dehydrogenase